MRTRAGWRLLRGLKFGARGSEGHGIEVKVYVYGGVGGKAWVLARGTDQIEIENCLGDETVPFLGWEVGVTRGQSSTEGILEGANCTFGGVAEMGIWGDKLEVDIVFAEGALHSAGAFIVEDVGWICLWHVIQASVISRTWGFFRRWAWIELV